MALGVSREGSPDSCLSIYTCIYFTSRKLFKIQQLAMFEQILKQYLIQFLKVTLLLFVQVFYYLPFHYLLGNPSKSLLLKTRVITVLKATLKILSFKALALLLRGPSMPGNPLGGKCWMMFPWLVVGFNPSEKQDSQLGL